VTVRPLGRRTLGATGRAEGAIGRTLGAIGRALGRRALGAIGRTIRGHRKHPVGRRTALARARAPTASHPVPSPPESNL